MEAAYPLLLTVLALALVAVEPVVPDFGALAVLGLIIAVAAALTAFSLDDVYGWCIVVICMIGGPVAHVFGMKMLAKSPYILRTALDEPDPDAPASAPSITVGDTGRTRSALRPMGLVRFGDIEAEAIAESAVINAGVEVEVVEMRAGKPVVREAR